MVVDSDLARELWPGEAVVGRCKELPAPPRVRFKAVQHSHTVMFGSPALKAVAHGNC